MLAGDVSISCSVNPAVATCFSPDFRAFASRSNHAAMNWLAAVMLPLAGLCDSLASDPTSAGDGEPAADVGWDADGTGVMAGKPAGPTAVAVAAGLAEVIVQITKPAPIITTTAKRPSKRTLARDRSGARRCPTS
jgi:hypothetical protein